MLGRIVGNYKSGVTRRIRTHLRQPDLVVWQGRYHDPIIRNAAAWNHIHEYVVHNPALWAEDVFYAG